MVSTLKNGVVYIVLPTCSYVFLLYDQQKATVPPFPPDFFQGKPFSERVLILVQDAKTNGPRRIDVWMEQRLAVHLDRRRLRKGYLFIQMLKLMMKLMLLMMIIIIITMIMIMTDIFSDDDCDQDQDYCLLLLIYYNDDDCYD